MFYQIFMRSFADSNRDGIGDLRGVMEHLDYLKGGTTRSLGVDALWLTPTYPSPLADYGYDISDYTAVDPACGDMVDFEELLEECNRRELKIILDMVPNHTSSRHPWFRESRSSRENPKRDWYVWRDGRVPGKPPNCWLSVMEGSAWTLDVNTGQCYYHAFLPEQPDVNCRNPEAHRAMLDACRFWLNKGVDGFRLDVINYLHEDGRLRDNPRKPGLRPYEMQKHLYDRCQPEDHDVIRELRRILDGYPEAMMVGETYTDDPREAAAYLGDGTDKLHLAFNFDFASTRWSAARFGGSVRKWDRLIPEAGWLAYFLSNHDMPRHISRLGRLRHAEARARAAAAMLLTLKGTPFLYYGEEIGMPSGRIPRKRLRDPVGIRFWPLPVGRDAARTPMQWNGGEYAGFSEVEPWLPVDGSRTVTNVETQVRDAGSLLSFYRSLIRLRREKPAPQVGKLVMMSGEEVGILSYIREWGNDRVAVFLNFTLQAFSFGGSSSWLAEGAWRVLPSTHGGKDAGSFPGDFRLEAYEALVLEAEAPPGETRA
ncbi:MAG: alpha-amylase family glycosyl hydrolase [Actinomycetota bacterium]|nr:alpha-amylase family glycosyl hydrolase [Actinomycetota bacterium]